MTVTENGDPVELLCFDDDELDEALGEFNFRFSSVYTMFRVKPLTFPPWLVFVVVFFIFFVIFVFFVVDFSGHRRVFFNGRWLNDSPVRRFVPRIFGHFTCPDEVVLVRVWEIVVFGRLLAISTRAPTR